MPWYRIEEQDVQLPDGRVVEGYPRMDLRDYSIVVALTAGGDLLVERLYKHGVGREVFDLVAGLIEDGEAPMDAARRELREEAGFDSSNWTTLGSFVINSNYGCGRMHAFLAKQCQRVAEPSSHDLEETEIILMPLDEALDGLRAGRFELLSAAAALALAHANLTA